MTSHLFFCLVFMFADDLKKKLHREDNRRCGLDLDNDKKIECKLNVIDNILRVIFCLACGLSDD